MWSAYARTGGMSPCTTKLVSTVTYASPGTIALAVDFAKNGEMVISAVKGIREISPLRKDTISRNTNISDQKRLKL